MLCQCLPLAISFASRTIWVRVCEAHRQPTIILVNASMMKQTCPTPAQVGTIVRSNHPEPVRRGSGELSVDQIRVWRSGGIGPCCLDGLGPGRALDTSGAHEPAGLFPADVNVGAACGHLERADT
jgi:hypothetical protein